MFHPVMATRRMLDPAGRRVQRKTCHGLHHHRALHELQNFLSFSVLPLASNMGDYLGGSPQPNRKVSNRGSPQQKRVCNVGELTRIFALQNTYPSSSATSLRQKAPVEFLVGGKGLATNSTGSSPSSADSVYAPIANGADWTPQSHSTSKTPQSRASNQRA